MPKSWPDKSSSFLQFGVHDMLEAGVDLVK